MRPEASSIISFHCAIQPTVLATYIPRALGKSGTLCQGHAPELHPPSSAVRLARQQPYHADAQGADLQHLAAGFAAQAVHQACPDDPPASDEFPV